MLPTPTIIGGGLVTARTAGGLVESIFYKKTFGDYLQRLYRAQILQMIFY